MVTSIEFERILSASRPSRGHVIRPSDGVYIGFGAHLATMVTHDLVAFLGVGMAKFISGAVFSVGLMLKVAHCGIPIVGGVSAPTFDAVEEARKLGICVCGFVCDDRLNVLSHGWRLG